MSWVRIHDAALSHPKLIGLVKLTDPFALWVWGLTYCQMHLTDGLIPGAALPRGAAKATTELMRRRLWESAAGDVRVHDYAIWNDSRETVLRKRAEAKQRMQEARERKQAFARTFARTSLENVPQRTDDEVLRGVGSSTGIYKKEEIRARSKRPIFSGQRLTVFEWQLDELMKTLGPYRDSFDLHEWFFTADGLACASGLVKAPREWWPWLLAETLAEAARRGLPVAPAGHLDGSKRVTEEASAMEEGVRQLLKKHEAPGA